MVWEQEYQELVEMAQTVCPDKPIPTFEEFQQMMEGKCKATCKSCGKIYFLTYDYATCLCGEQVFRDDFVSKMCANEGIYSHAEYQNALNHPNNRGN